jgi:N-acetylglucosaminyl-diphospho-decaprenol L-rhamnosyltransferase
MAAQLSPRHRADSGRCAWFSIVIPTWNSAGELPALIASLAANLDGTYETVIVDNASADRTVEVAGSLDPSARIQSLTENRGFAAAANLGVRTASTDVVVLLNPDTRVVDGSLRELAATARRSTGLFGPRLLNEDGSPQISAFPPPGGWELAVTVVVPHQLMPRRLLRRCEPWRLDETLNVGWLSAACLAARRELLLALGPFDERLQLYGEDTELGLRAGDLGVPSIFVPNVARVIHLMGRSSEQRYDDRGMRAMIETRRRVVRERRGPLRALYDSVGRILFFAGRWAAKRALGRDASADAAWLRAAIGTEARRAR